MTRIFTLLLLSFIASVTAKAQEVALVYPTFDQYENFEDVYIAPEGRGYAVGSCNTLYLTTNDGASWTLQNPPAAVTQLFNVQCAPGTNCETVFLSTNRGTYRKANASSNWVSVLNQRFNILDFSQSGAIYSYQRGRGNLYRSDDDGLSWTEIPLQRFIVDDLQVLPNNNLAMIGDSSFLRSSDGGATWEETINFGRKAMLITTDSDGNHYVETRGSNIYKSENGGTSWTQKAENAHQYSSYHDLYKDAEDSLHVISFNGARFSSGDDGATWAWVARSRFQRYNSFRRAEGRMIAAGDGIAIFVGNDDYTDMTSLFGNSYPEFREITFHDTDTGYAFGEEGEVFRTTNGGDNWEMTSQIDTWMQSRPKVAPDGSIYGVRDLDDFIRSTDGGRTWTSLTAANNLIQASSSRVVFDVLDNGEVVVITKDKAIRLAPNNSVISNESGGEAIINGGTFDLKMVTADLGFIIRWARSEIYRTEDGGQTWTTIEPFGGNDFFNWFEVEDENTFLIGNGRNSWRSTDAGQTWAEYSAFTALGRFFIGDDLYGFTNSRLNRSRDDGANFEAKFTTCESPLDMVRRPGTNEVFLTYKNGIERLDINEILSPVRTPRPEAVSLRAVPNPTNGMVQVTVPGETGRNGVAELFDLTGRKTNVPTSQAGDQLQLDLSPLRPGCYVLRYASAEGKLFQARLIRN